MIRILFSNILYNRVWTILNLFLWSDIINLYSYVHNISIGLKICVRVHIVIIWVSGFACRICCEQRTLPLVPSGASNTWGTRRVRSDARRVLSFLRARGPIDRRGAQYEGDHLSGASAARTVTPPEALNATQRDIHNYLECRRYALNYFI